jgi:cytidylate kinase
MAIVTISRELGSNSIQIAEAVAAQLGVHCIDKEVVAEMARKAGVSVEVITHAEEQLLAKPVAVSDEMRALMSARRGATMTEGHFINLMRDAVKLLAGQENVVFIGTGAQVILKDHPAALHVHLYAPPTVRAERIRQRRSLPTVEAAQRVINKADEDRRNWYRHFFSGVDWKNARHYHLMIDTARISAAVAANLIVQAAQTAPISP